MMQLIIDIYNIIFFGRLMATYNTQFDSANTAVRAFLTRLGEYYLGRSFNTTVKGQAKSDWIKIKDEIFEGKCAYCGKSTDIIQMDHLIMINRNEYGLHHPGNIVPACSKCNKRSKDKNKNYNKWENHLLYVCERDNEKSLFAERWKKIKDHINNGEFAYPKLTSEEKKAIQIIVENLYNSIKNEFDKAMELYKKLDESFASRE